MSRESILTVEKARVLRAYLSKLYNIAKSVIALGVVESVACEDFGVYRKHYYSFARLSENALGGRNFLDRRYSWEKRCSCILEYAHRMDIVASHIELQTGESLTELCERYKVLKAHIRQVLTYAKDGYAGERSPEYLLYAEIFGDVNIPTDYAKLLNRYIEQLSPRPRVLIKMLKGVGSNLYTVNEISGYFNITNSRLHAIEKRCFDYIRGFAKKDRKQKTVKNIQCLCLSPRATTCLLRAGYDTVDKLNGVTLQDLETIRNMGTVCALEVIDVLLTLPEAKVLEKASNGGYMYVNVKNSSDIGFNMKITFNCDKI